MDEWDYVVEMGWKRRWTEWIQILVSVLLLVPVVWLMVTAWLGRADHKYTWRGNLFEASVLLVMILGYIGFALAQLYRKRLYVNRWMLMYVPTIGKRRYWNWHYITWVKREEKAKRKTRTSTIQELFSKRLPITDTGEECVEVLTGYAQNIKVFHVTSKMDNFYEFRTELEQRGFLAKPDITHM